MDSEKLVEAVARSIASHGEFLTAEDWECYAEEARAAVRIVVEECRAKARDCAIYDEDEKLINSDIRKTCADAIRSLSPDAKEQV